MLNNTPANQKVIEFPAPKLLNSSDLAKQKLIKINPFSTLKTAFVLALRFWKVWIPPVWLVFMFVLPIGMFAVFGVSKTYSNLPIGNVTIAAMVMVNMAQYAVFTTSASLASRIGVEANNGWLQQIKSSPISLGCYNLSRVMALIILSLAQALAVYIYGAANGVTMGIKPFFGSLLALIVTLLLSTLIGICIGVIMKTDAASSLIGSASWLIAMFSGMYMPLDQLGNFFVKIGYFMPMWGSNQIILYGLGVSTALNWKVVCNIIVWTTLILVGLYYGSRRAVKR